MSHLESQRTRGLLCAIGGCLAWGFSGTCAQFLLEAYHVPSLTLTTIRLLVAGPLLLGFLALRGKLPSREMFRGAGNVFHLLFLGFVGIFLGQLTYLETIAYTNAGTATMLGCLSSPALLIVVCLWKRRLPRPFELLGVALAIAATWLIATGGDPGTLAISELGLLWGFACAAMITIYTLHSKPLMAQWGSMPTIAVGMIVGGIMCVAIALPQWYFPELDPLGWAALAAMVIVGTCVSYSLFFQAILDLPPVEVGMLSIIEPVSATAFSAVLLHTEFSPADLVGFGLMILMVLIIALAGDEPDAPAQ